MTSLTQTDRFAQSVMQIIDGPVDWLGQALSRKHLSGNCTPASCSVRPGFPHDDQFQPEMERCMTTKRQSPLLPAVIVVLLLALLVFLLVSPRKTGVSHPQSETQDR
jgi:hypothetical protein